MKRRLFLVVATFVALALVLASCAAPAANPQKTLKAGEIKHYSSYAAIAALLKQAGRNGPFFMRDLAGAPEAALDSKSGNDYSTTNVQVAGVDEADVVKTDGSFLYLIANGRFLVVDVRDPAAMKVVSEIKYASDAVNEYPVEMFLDVENQRATVITGSYRELPAPTGAAETPGAVEPAKDKAADAMIRPGIWYGYGMSTTAARVYDISDPTAPQLVRSFEQDGSYLSSRRIGSAVYLITNRYTWYDGAAPTENLIPAVRSGSGDFAPIPAGSIGIVKSNDYSSFLVVSGVDTVDASRQADTKALLGAGNVLYASESAIYVAVQRWEQQEVTPAAVTDVPVATKELPPPETTGSATEPNQGDGTGTDGTTPVDPVLSPPETRPTDPASVEEKPTSAPVETKGPDAPVASDSKDVFTVMPMPVVETYTDIFRFSIANAKVSEDGAGTVPGYVLNQFAMDEKDGFLRVATTVGDSWRTDEYTSLNNLYVLDGSLKIVGKVEGLASRETIKSVRFLGDRAYLVTFRTTDPLFVLDLASPTAPKVLGELKIPGYSEYLHPYADGLLLGFGKDAIVQGDMAYYLGMKFSMFDVSDATAPTEIAKLSIGDRGTYSEISYNHKALLFSKDRDLIGIPITINRVPKDQKADPIAYGQPVWQGFLILGYDAEKGLYVRGMVTNSNKDLDWTQPFASYEDIAGKADQEALYGPRTITRGVQVGDVLYTISGGLVKASTLSDFSALGTVELPGFGEYYGGRVMID